MLRRGEVDFRLGIRVTPPAAEGGKIKTGVEGSSALGSRTFAERWGVTPARRPAGFSAPAGGLSSAGGLG